MALKDLSSYLTDDTLEVPLGGKVYRIAAPDADTGLYLVALAQVAERNAAGGQITREELESLRFEDDREVDFTRLVLGDTYDELRADKVSLVKVGKLTQYAFIYFTMGEKVADHMLEPPPGEAPAPNRATRRKTASRAGAISTRQPASTAGTTSARKRKPRPKAT